MSGKASTYRVLRLMLWIAVAFIVVAGNPSLAHESSPRTVRIGIVTIGYEKGLTRYLSAFREQLKASGYVEGSNLEIEGRWANGDFSRLDGMAEDLVREKVDILVASTTYDVRAAKRATSTIPIVMVNAADPVATGLVADLVRPGGNVTGLSLMTVELSTKRLQILKDALAGLARVAVLWNPDHPLHSRVVEGIKAAAPALSLQPVFLAAQTPEQLPVALTAAKRARAQALLVIEDPLFYLNRAAISQLAEKERLPAMYGAKEYADVGGLLSYGPNYEDLWRRAAGFVDKILRGAKPSDIPIEQPTTFEFVVNARSARSLGLRIPESTLVQATEIIK